ncbi:MAG: SDR family NAD(P)-dependent oxidoreductase [Haliangiales bacterium]
MSSEFADKPVVVTGASGGLGRAVVAALLARGADCYLPAYESSAPEELAWRDHERVHFSFDIDLCDPDAVQRYYQGLPDLWASVHLTGGFSMAPIEDTSVADLRRMMALNLETCFSCCREAIRFISGTAHGGRLVNVSARPALTPTAGMAAYAISKAAVAALTEALAAETVEREVLVNAVVPSMFDTPSNRAAMPDSDFDRWPKPEEIASAICYLASPANQLTSGALVPVYGRM